MARRTSATEDDWHNVTDAKKRKQIQDRLAQRARRRRLREAKIADTKSNTNTVHVGPASISLTHADTLSSTSESGLSGDFDFCFPVDFGSFPLLLADNDNIMASTVLELAAPANPSTPDTTIMNFDFIDPNLLSVDVMNGDVPTTNFPLITDSSHQTTGSTTVSIFSSISTSTPPSTTHTTSSSATGSLPPPRLITNQPTFPMTLFTALYINGTFLSITCTTTVPAKTPPCDRAVPPSLRPTDSQLNTVHPRWYDRFPFPRVRDAMILLGVGGLKLFDDEDLVNDLFTKPSFNIREGCEPWDPSGWSIESSFREKWGWVFCNGY